LIQAHNQNLNQLQEIKFQLLFGLFILLNIGLIYGCSDTDEHTPIEYERPNIVVIVVDDMGYADLSAYPHSALDINTPQMDRLAEEGALFTRAYVTAPVCSPSRAGWNFGRYQWRWGDTGWEPGISPDTKHLAQYLKEAGYVTGKIGKNDYGVFDDEAALPLNLGYDEFLGFNRHAHDYWLHSQAAYDNTPDPEGDSAHLGPLLHNNGWQAFSDGTHLTDILTDAAADFLKDHQDESFFLTLSYNAVHHLVHQAPDTYLYAEGVGPIENYEPGSEAYYTYYNRYNDVGAISSDDMRRFYRASLRKLDDAIGRILDKLDELNLTDNTLVIFFGDNGGSPLTGANNAPLTAGKYSIHEGGVRVPFIVRWPGEVPAGIVYEHPSSTLDIVPTCLQAAEITPQPDTLDGFNLLDPLVTDEPVGGEDRVFLFRWQNTYAIIQGDWKLTNQGDTMTSGNVTDLYIPPVFTTEQLRLFNLREDIEEAVDLFDIHPDIAAELQEFYNDTVMEADVR